MQSRKGSLIESLVNIAIGITIGFLSNIIVLPAFGYEKVNLQKSGKKECVFVHRIVCASFKGNRHKPYEVAHYDGNPSNNNIENLRWALPIENQSDRKRHGTRLVKEKHPRAKLSQSDVDDIRKRLIEGQTQNYIANIYNVSRTCISSISTGRSW